MSWFRITGFLDFIRRPKIEILENSKFRKLVFLPSSGERGGESAILMEPQVSVEATSTLLDPSPLAFLEEGNMSSFRNIAI
jgi:hypothetical protein